MAPRARMVPEVPMAHVEAGVRGCGSTWGGEGLRSTCHEPAASSLRGEGIRSGRSARSCAGRRASRTTAHSSRRPAPSASSTLPPPMSTTRARLPSRWIAVERGQVDEARLAPPRRRPAARCPISRPTCSRKSSPLRASRTAEVATARILSTPCVSARRLYFAQHRQAALHGRGGEPAAEQGARRRAAPSPSPGSITWKPPERLHLHDHHVDGVAAEVDGGDLHRGGSSGLR